MKLVTFLKDGHDQLGMVVNEKIYALEELHRDLPGSMSMFLNYWDELMPMAIAVEQKVKDGLVRNEMGDVFADAELFAPVPSPTSCRDGYAFRQHVAAARRNRKVDMITEFDQYPIFYFTNHNSIQGPGDIVCMPETLVTKDEKFDYDEY